MAYVFGALHLRLMPLPKYQIDRCLNDLPGLEQEIGLSITHNQFGEKIIRALHMKLKKDY
jgi:hypothetical protein